LFKIGEIDMVKCFLTILLTFTALISFANGSNASQSTKYKKLMNYNVSGLCSKNGGKMVTQYTGSHKPYQVCIFEDNRQCEVKALNSGACPVRGIKITGYDKPEEIYCAIKGGEVKAEKHAKCRLPSGKIYSAHKLYYAM
jgi:putative hemolysin